MTDKKKALIYQQCPVLESEYFTFRLVQTEDAEDLLLCYSDPKAQEFFNDEDFPVPTRFYTPEEMSKCIKFWLMEYSQEAYIRFSIVDKAKQKAVGTVEMFGMVGAYKADPGILRIDVAHDYENKAHLKDILGVCVGEFYDMFGVRSIVTKAVPQAADRINVLQDAGFRPGQFHDRQHYYSRSGNWTCSITP
jgi:RimJ/RimL family protein N-acetyltransferase